MSGLEVLRLTCTVCGGEWEMERRRGQYPSVCPACLGRRLALSAARQVRRELRRLDVAVPELGVAIAARGLRVETPWHEPGVGVVLYDAQDAIDLASEMEHRR